MDRFQPPFLGRRRGWLATTQLALAALIGCMGLLSPRDAPWLTALCALGIAFLSASQDIVVDAYRTDVLRAEERGAGAAVSVLGYRLAMLVSGAGALILADQWLGWQAMYWTMAAMMLVGFVATWFALEPPGAAAAPKTLRDAVTLPLAEYFSRRGAWWLLLLIVLYKLGDAFAGNLTTAFLLRGPGFTATEVGAISKGFGLVATIAGALAGGALMAKLRLYRALMLFGILQAVTNLGFMILAAAGKSYPMLYAVIGAENLCGGMGTAGLCGAPHGALRPALLGYAIRAALCAFGRRPRLRRPRGGISRRVARVGGVLFLHVPDRSAGRRHAVRHAPADRGARFTSRCLTSPSLRAATRRAAYRRPPARPVRRRFRPGRTR
jgi:PAT family beta-lactamase induction signal transducer AmpG